jgi:beta-glucosidase-like glycosyl hydrolase
MHGNESLLTEVLKKRMGFDGFVVGDWECARFASRLQQHRLPCRIQRGRGHDDDA